MSAHAQVTTRESKGVPCRTLKLSDQANRILFNGSSQFAHVSYQAALNILTSWSIEFWVTPKVLPASGSKDLIDCTESGSKGFKIYCPNTGTVTISIGDGTNTRTKASSSQWAYFALNHIVMVYDATTKKAELYVNAVSQGLTSAMSPDYLPPVARPLRFGCGNSSGTPANYSCCEFHDQIRFFTKALSSTEVTALYNKTSVAGSLLSQWDITADSQQFLLKDSVSGYDALLWGYPRRILSSPVNSCCYDLPVYDSNPNVTHNSVVEHYVSGYRYWMAFTPFPDAERENPSIVASNDQYNWEVPAGVTNPIVPQSEATTDGYSYWSDTELLWWNNKFYLYYRALSGSKEAIYLKTSTDGITWSARTKVLANDAEYRNRLSPAVVVEADNSLSMYLWDQLGAIVNKYTSTNGTTWTGPTACTITLENGSFTPFHLDVDRYRNRYWMLIAATDQKLYLAHSSDGTTFKVTISANSFRPFNLDYEYGGFYRTSMFIDSFGRIRIHPSGLGVSATTRRIGGPRVPKIII